MLFRDFLNEQILELVRFKRHYPAPKHLKQEMFFFQIGCFPSSEENLNHEYPKLLETCRQKNMNCNLILIDPEYKNFLEKNNIRDRIFDYQISTFVYENTIESEDYNTLVEFCHFISNFDCLSVIMEMTGQIRRELYISSNHTNYLFICESDCLIHTDNILYNPVLELHPKKVEIDKKMIVIDRYYFYRAENIDYLYEELKYDSSDKSKYIIGLLQQRFLLVSSFYLKILNYMKIKPKDVNYEIDLTIFKNNPHYYILIRSLVSRFYHDKERLDELIREFYKSDYCNLEVFVKKKIFFIFISCLHYKFRGDTSLIQLHSDKILFEEDTDIRNVSDYFSDIFI